MKAGQRIEVLGPEYTLQLVDYMGGDLSPLMSARISTGNITGEDVSKDDRLRNRLWSDKHTSPFETNIAVFELVIPMFVLRQIDRHRTVSVTETKFEVIEDYDDFRKYTSRNEHSARYADMPDLFYVPPKERFQRKNLLNKQGSGEQLSEADQEKAYATVAIHGVETRTRYRELLDMGVSNEIARVILPMNQATRIRLQASLLNWFRFLELRMAPDAQLETRAYANGISEVLRELWPKCWQAFVEHTLHAVTLSRSEAQALRSFLEGSPITAEERAQILKKLQKTPAA